MVDIVKYYQTIRHRIENGNFQLKVWNEEFVQQNSISFLEEACKINSHLEAIHYLIYEFWLDRKDPRLHKIFDYVCIPEGVNQSNGLDIDFSKWSSEEFLQEIMKLKD